MTSGGRPRREDERPDSRFGRLLKDYIWHAEDFVQADLAAETGISERALSNMVKGERKSGHKLRRDLRSIVRVLHEREVLTTLDQANELITSIPGVGPLHEDDPEDAKIITLFNTPPVVGTRFIASASAYT